MNFPKSIMLLGRKVEIIEAPAVCEGKSVNGTYDHDLRTITLGPCYNDQEKFELLCHEAAHCHITLTGWDQNLSKREIELLCQLMTNFTVDIIRGTANENKKSTPNNRKSSTKTRPKGR